MNKQTIILIAALTAPLIGLAVLSQTTVKPAGMSREGAVRPAQKRHQITLEHMRGRIKQRITQLENMSPERWKDERIQYPHLPESKEMLIKRKRDQLAQLQAMKPQDWNFRRWQEEQRKTERKPN